MDFLVKSLRRVLPVLQLFTLLNLCSVSGADGSALEKYRSLIRNQSVPISLEAFPGELCMRSCEDTQPRVCYFNWVLEHYHAMGPACKACAAGNHRDCFQHSCLTADGFERGVMSINRQIPGPPIQVCKDDLIVVDMMNAMGGTASTMHWHGLHQRDTPYMDGVPFVTQCPIEFMSTFRYAFWATEPGTQFYHSHSGHHKVNGHYGAMVIRQPEVNDPNAHLYDFDSPDHTILASDWMHVDGEMFMPGLPSGGGILPKNVLINGKGTFTYRNGSKTNAPREVFRVRKGGRYRFRFINAASHVCPLELQVEGHPLQIIASDSFNLQPISVNTLVTTSGERYDFVVKADQPSDPSSANYLAPVTSPGVFATRNNTKVTAQKGGTALLPCTLLSHTSALVSWVRRRDFQLLTVGLSTYSSDERFLVEHIRHMGHWALRIKTVRDEDQGLYECQLSVHPVQSVFVELQVVEAVADIVGAPDLHIDEGSTLRLECKLKQATEYPEYVFWYHQQNMVNFDQQNGFSVTPFQPAGTALPAANDDSFGAVPVDLNHLGSFHHNHHHHHHHRRRGGHHHHHQPYSEDNSDATVNGDDDDDDGSFGLNALELLGPPGLLLPDAGFLGGDEDPLAGWSLLGGNHTGTTFLPYSRILSPATSVLTIKKVHSKHAGNYTCAPSNTHPASITVHVLQGEKPAAMQHANRSQQQPGGQPPDQALDLAKNAATSGVAAPATAIVALLLPLLMALAPALVVQRENRRWVAR